MTNTELIEANKKLETEKQQLETEKQELKSKLQHIEFQFEQLRRLVFGSKRERFVSNTAHGQMSLPFDIPEPKQKQVETENISYSRNKKSRDNHPGRLPLPDHLPVEEIILEPVEDTTGMKCIGKEVTDQLELIPAKLFIKRFIRPKYVKTEDEDQQTFKGIIASLPVFPITKGIAGPGLLAQIMIDKFMDHLPIYRQIERFKREGINMPSSTINGWQEAVCNLLQPLYDTLKHRVSNNKEESF